MIQSKNSETYRLVSAVCCAVVALYRIVNGVIAISKLGYHRMGGVPFVLSLILYLVLAVTLFSREKTAVLGAVVAMALYRAYALICFFSVGNLCSFLAYAALALILVLSIQENEIVKNIWFLAGALMLAGCLTEWIQYGNLSVPSMLFSLVQISALSFAGLWIVSLDDKGVAAPMVSPSVVGTADQLKACKELLDVGAITQEEFDTKKREILGS